MFFFVPTLLEVCIVIGGYCYYYFVLCLSVIFGGCVFGIKNFNAKKDLYVLHCTIYILSVL